MIRVLRETWDADFPDDKKDWGKMSYEELTGWYEAIIERSDI